MTTYTAIPDANLEPGKPARSVDALLLRDNPIAISEGSAGAPKILDAALDSTVTAAGSTWVRDRIAITTAGSIGSYAFLIPESLRDTDYTNGSTLAGSSLRYAGFGPAGSSPLGLSDGGIYGSGTLSFSPSSPSGTWRCMGRSTNDDGGVNDYLAASLWLRIS